LSRRQSAFDEAGATAALAGDALGDQALDLGPELGADPDVEMGAAGDLPEAAGDGLVDRLAGHILDDLGGDQLGGGEGELGGIGARRLAEFLEALVEFLDRRLERVDGGQGRSLAFGPRVRKAGLIAFRAGEGDRPVALVAHQVELGLQDRGARREIRLAGFAAFRLERGEDTVEAVFLDREAGLAHHHQ
jgi:hypothetical protein